MSVVGFIRKALAAGLDIDTALAMGEAFETEAQPMAPELSPRQARNRRYYEAKRLKASEKRLNASETSEIKTLKTVSDDFKTIKTLSDAEPRARVRDNPLKLVIPGVVGVGVGSARATSDDWPAGRASDHARLLVEAVGSHWLDPDRSPDLVTTSGRLAAWRRDGASWEHDVMAVVVGLCGHRRSRIASWKFFDQAVARSIAENRAALEIPEASGNRPTGPPRTIDEKSAAAWDYAIAKIAQDEQS